MNCTAAAKYKIGLDHNDMAQQIWTDFAKWDGWCFLELIFLISRLTQFPNRVWCVCMHKHTRLCGIAIVYYLEHNLFYFIQNS